MNKEKIIEILENLEIFKINTKGLHWNAEQMTGKAAHLICDEIYGEINGFQDIIAEYYMGVTFDSLTQNDFNPIGNSLSNNPLDNPTDLLIALSDYCCSIHATLSEVDGNIWIGLKSEIETFIAKLVKFRYLSLLK